jgi:hypothetical protein
MADWASFYVIVGTAGAALIGIQFVVVTLIANLRRRPPAETVEAFGTPTVVHLTGAVLVSALMSAPWHSLVAASVTLATCGAAGFVYAVIAFRRAHRQTFYQPVWQDWFWFAILPCVVYATLTIAAIFVRANSHVALLVVAAATFGLLIIGIHNSWDTVTHVVATNSPESRRRTSE